jgi:tRNA dimethylallyltransferase
MLDRFSRTAPILIAGPTASGKSALAMLLAARDGRTIVNADALQVHDAWRVLTARPSQADEAAYPHALYGHVAKGRDYSVGHWLHEVAPLLARPVVIVGGTGLYFTALTDGLAPVPPTPAAVRAEGMALLRDQGLSALVRALDAPTAAQIDLRNPARVARAWEVLTTTGRGLADWQAETGPAALPLSEADAWVISTPTPTLNARIDARFDAMVANGALAEVAGNAAGFDPRAPWSRAIGADPLLQHLAGQLSLPAAIAQAQTLTRQYAKRQRTWFRSRLAHWQSVPGELFSTN